MTKQTVIKFDMSGFDELKKKAGGTYTTRVGVLGSHAARTEGDSTMNNAEIGVLQMFGSVKDHIPPRDFLLMPLQYKRKEFIKAMENSTIKAAFESGDYKKVYELLGIKAEQFIQEAFETAGFGQWPPNSPVTIAMKGSSAPLIGTGQLKRAITSDVVKKGATESSAGAFQGAV